MKKVVKKKTSLLKKAVIVFIATHLLNLLFAEPVIKALIVPINFIAFAVIVIELVKKGFKKKRNQ